MKNLMGLIQVKKQVHRGISRKTPWPYAICYCVSTGSSYYDNVRPLAYPDSDAVLVCFDISRPETLDSVIKKVSVLFLFRLLLSTRWDQHLIYAVILETLTGRNPVFLDQHLSTHWEFCASSLHFHGSTIEQISTEVRASISFISSKHPWILDPRPSEKWKVRVKNERRGFAPGWVWVEYQMRILAISAISKRSCCRAFSRVLKFPFCRHLKFKIWVLCRTVSQKVAYGSDVVILELRLAWWWLRGCGHGCVLWDAKLNGFICAHVCHVKLACAFKWSLILKPCVCVSLWTALLVGQRQFPRLTCWRV